MFLRQCLTCATIVAVTWLAAGTAEAQGQGGRGRGFGFGGRGVISLAAEEAVQKDLGVSADDAAKLKKISDDYRQESRSEFEKAGFTGGFQNMSEEDRKKMGDKMTEIRKTLEAKFMPQLKEILTSDQFTRVQQIRLQAQGVQALSDADTVKALELSKEQQDKITALNEEYRKKFGELFTAGAGGNRDEIRTKMQDMGKEREAKLTEVLTKPQQEKFASLKGKEFDLTQIQGGPGGRRRTPQQN